MVNQDAVTAIQRTFGYRFQEAKCRYDRAGRQNVAFEIAAMVIGPDCPLAIIGNPKTATPPAATAAFKTLRREIFGCSVCAVASCFAMSASKNLKGSSLSIIRRRLYKL